MQEHKKLYKSGKNWKVATIATLAVAGAAVTTTNGVVAHADEVAPASTSVATQSQASQSGQTALETAVQKDKQAVSQAQANVDSASAVQSSKQV